ncbi:MAG: hypothetical protein M1820_000657 [Bogoriella megaspora]|nr:MAG: hypothetical protein M1820_000657 [Bogoriella megaspora]
MSSHLRHVKWGTLRQQRPNITRRELGTALYFSQSSKFPTTSSSARLGRSTSQEPRLYCVMIFPPELWNRILYFVALEDAPMVHSYALDARAPPLPNPVVEGNSYLWTKRSTIGKLRQVNHQTREQLARIFGRDFVFHVHGNTFDPPGPPMHSPLVFCVRTRGIPSTVRQFVRHLLVRPVVIYDRAPNSDWSAAVEIGKGPIGDLGEFFPSLQTLTVCWTVFSDRTDHGWISSYEWDSKLNMCIWEQFAGLIRMFHGLQRIKVYWMDVRIDRGQLQRNLLEPMERMGQ